MTACFLAPVRGAPGHLGEACLAADAGVEVVEGRDHVLGEREAVDGEVVEAAVGVLAAHHRRRRRRPRGRWGGPGACTTSLGMGQARTVTQFNIFYAETQSSYNSDMRDRTGKRTGHGSRLCPRQDRHRTKGGWG